MAKYRNVDVRYIEQDVIFNPKWDDVKKQLENITVSILVNNVGGGSAGSSGGAGYFHANSLESHQKVLDFNFGAALGYTSILLPSMVARDKGRILSCSSLGYMFGYHESVYGATKTAVHGLSLTLNNEYYGTGVRAEALVIGLVSTPAIGNMQEDFLGYCVSPELIARNSIEKFGFREVYAPGKMHELMNVASKLMPLPIRSLCARDGYEALISNIQTAKSKPVEKEL